MLAVGTDGIATTRGARIGTVTWTATPVSLTGQLATGELGRWCAATLTGTGHLAADVAAATAGVAPVRPSRVDDAAGHWATIGGAFGQRLAFATQHAPPYYALLGAHRAGLADWATLHRAAAAFPTHTTLDPERAGRANQLRPLPGGRWVDLDAQPGDRYTGRAATGTRDRLVVDLVERLVAYLAAHAPPGRLADSRAAEARLARVCVVLTDWESAYRTGQLPARFAALYTDPDTTVPDFLDAVGNHQVAELLELAIRADHAGVLARLPGGISGPVLVEHWADGDLLIPAAAAAGDVSGGGGMVLLDVKTVTSARDPDRVARWLWQLLGYAWLDPGDRYRIRSVGLYLARHAVLCTWSLDRFAAALLDGRDVDASAAEFRRLAARVITAETGQPAR